MLTSLLIYLLVQGGRAQDSILDNIKMTLNRTVEPVEKFCLMDKAESPTQAITLPKGKKLQQHPGDVEGGYFL